MDEASQFITAHYVDSWDDPNDDDLPIQKSRSIQFDRYLTQTNDDGEIVQVLNDVTTLDQIVQDICAAVWTDA
tara:strand:- start:7 stop:225 length:219 start_codon:yes stop_codon:yes gene_type:complete